MSIARSLIVVLSLAPAAAAAQHASAPVVVRVPNLAWIGPVVAGATASAAAALEGVGPALAQARVSIGRVGPAMAAARMGMAHSQAAMARAGFSFQGLQGLEGLRGLEGLQGIVSLDLDDDDDYQRSAPPAWAPQDPADATYKDARSALNRSRYGEAAGLFEQVYTKFPKSEYAGDAYYWQAYALRRRGGDANLKKALDVLAMQKQKAPNASTRTDADDLATRIRGDLAQSGDEASSRMIQKMAVEAGDPPTPPTPVTPRTPSSPPSPRIAGSGKRSRDRCDDEDDTQAAALNALLSMDGDKALPILKKVLARRDEGSLCLRRKAVFMVSQHESAETEDILLAAARSDPDQEVREQAVWWLSQVDSPKAVSALDSILRSSPDPVLQDKAIFALSQQDSPKARQALKDFALKSGISEELREKAIFWIGQGDDPDRLPFLKTLYVQLKNESARDKILFSVSQIEGRESERWLMQVAGDANEDIELRKKALFWVGQSDAPGIDLYTLYEKMPSKEMKEQLIFVYSQRSERAAVDKLFAIARTETDKTLKSKAIFWLGQSGDPRAADFLAKLLEP
ncbi:MAG TPA: HEAT repeat domain-containing protein [Gemmatimonadales bacterium]|nr:HEAT repeat domain-containing protein [Gemmatimonadales bacterium]